MEQAIGEVALRWSRIKVILAIVTSLLLTFAAWLPVAAARTSISSVSIRMSTSSDYFTHISSGGNSSCGLEAGGWIVCWGDDEYGESDPPTGRFVAVSVGSGGQSCAIESNLLRVACWGSAPGSLAPPVPSGRFLQVNSGLSIDCGITTEANAMCWTFYGPGNKLRTWGYPGDFVQISAGIDACGIRSLPAAGS
jgi:hypothetical protein